MRKLGGTPQQFRRYLKQSEKLHSPKNTAMCPLAHWQSERLEKEVRIYPTQAAVSVGKVGTEWRDMPDWMRQYVSTFDRVFKGKDVVTSGEALSVLEAVA